jgi:hypothetical protein
VLASGGIAPPFLTSAVDGGDWSASRPCRFTLGGNWPRTHWIEGWVGSRAGLGPAWNWNPAVQPVAWRYTEWQTQLRCCYCCCNVLDIFGRRSVRISAAMLAHVFRGFPQSHQVNTELLPRSGHDRFHSNDPAIGRCITPAFYGTVYTRIILIDTNITIDLLCRRSHKTLLYDTWRLYNELWGH